MRILEYGTSGPGRALEDRTAEILAANEAKPRPDTNTDGEAGGEPAPDGGNNASKGRKGSGGCSVGSAGGGRRRR
jgi:hypothetical protein